MLTAVIDLSPNTRESTYLMEVIDHQIVLRRTVVADAAAVRQLLLTVVLMHVEDQRGAITVGFSTDLTQQRAFLVRL